MSSTDAGAGLMWASLVSSYTPAPWGPPSDLRRDLPMILSLTEPVPDGAVIEIDDTRRGESADVVSCTGSGPYVVRLRERLSQAYVMGTPVAWAAVQGGEGQ